MTTIENAAGWNGPALTEIRHDEVGRPVLFTNALLLSLDPLIGTIAGDVLVGGSLIVGVGPGIVTAAGDDNAIVVDATGTAIVPAVVDGLALVGARNGRAGNIGTLTPGNTGDLLVVPNELAPDAPTALATLLTAPERVRALLVTGTPVLWDGQRVPGRPDAPVAASRLLRT